MKATDVPKNNLPTQLTSFIGREKEMREICNLLISSDLLSLTGTGGAGKTRLAIRLAEEALGEFTGGTWYVDLASLAEPDQVVPAVAQVLAVREDPARTLIDSLSDAIAEDRVLLLIDNCEHVVEACRTLVDHLIPRCPRLKIVATSREPLHNSSETVYRVPSMAIPPDVLVQTNAPIRLDAEHSTDLSSYDAIRLFVERAKQCRPSFELAETDGPTLVKLCARLDGVPLAIELAAARCRNLTLDEINILIDNRFRWLTGGSKAALPRHQTLGALVDWSFELLSGDEQRFLGGLSVFAGGFTAESAHKVCRSEDADATETRRLINSLRDKSLIQSEGSDRHSLLQTLRAYGALKLHGVGETTSTHDRHRDAFCRLAEQAGKRIESKSQREWLDRLDAERENLRAALAWCVSEGDPDEKGLLLCGNLYTFWWIRGYWSEARRWLSLLLKVSRGAEPSEVYGDALMESGHFALYQGDYDVAREQFHRSLDVRSRHENAEKMAEALHSLGHLAHLKGDVAAARPLYEQSLAIRRLSAEPGNLTTTLNNLANVLQEFREYRAAREMHQEALQIRRQIGATQGIAQSLHNIGCLALEMGDFAEAERYLKEGLSLYRSLQDTNSLSQAMQTLGDLAALTDRTVAAAKLWGCAERLREAIGAPMHEIDRVRLEQEFERVRQLVGPAPFKAAWNAGRNMSVDRAARLLDRA
ncbi:MAG: tetratricopeptide repeat protein [Fimbriimonas sp.]|nr:tetratricopeptide repeat protein [Fimbriimonas sp.]